jgi:hypothetical protein
MRSVRRRQNVLVRAIGAACSSALLAGLMAVVPAAVTVAHAAQVSTGVVPAVSSPAAVRSVSVPGGVWSSGSVGSGVGGPPPIEPLRKSGPPSAGMGFVAGKSVENVAARTQTMKVFDNPDGSHVAEISTEPLHFRDPSKGGAWSDIDPTLTTDASRPGWYRTTANSWKAWFGPTPSVEIDLASGGVQTMSPVGGAAVAPVLGSDGLSVTYPSVWPNVDLRYVVSASGVEEDIVVNGPPGRSSFDFATGSTSYAVAAGGGMSPVGAASDALPFAAPVVRDSTGVPVEAASPSLSPVSVPGGAGVRVSVSSGWSPTYPYVIDPSYTNGSGNMTDYKSDGYSCEPCGVQIGNSQSGSGGAATYWRSVGYFTYTPLLGDAVSALSLELDNQKAGTANSDPFWVTHATAYSYGGAAGNPAILQNNIGSGGTFSDTRLTQFYDYLTSNRVDGAALGSWCERRGCWG